MENSKFVNYKYSLLLIFGVFLGVFILIFSFVFAYSPYNTHPDLTEEIAKFWNLKNENQDLEISQKEINWMREGAINEDEPPRWINHFYDPIHNEGWKGRHFGDLSEEEGYKMGADVAPKEAIASVDWATNQEYQSAYGKQYGNQTWQKAIKSYLDGDKKSTFIALGHILHLVEDVSVPDHTRNDTHADLYGDSGSPYEGYSKKYTNFNKLTVAVELVQQNKNPLDFQNLTQAFDYLAEYSNKNFFSEDTISNEEFEEPDLGKLESKIENIGIKKYLFLYNQQKQIYLAILKEGEEYSTDNNSFVFSSYFTNLSEQAVLTGASVIELFFKEVKKYQENKESSLEILPDQHESFFQTLKHAPKLALLNIADFTDRNTTKLEVMAIKTYQLAKDTIKNISLKTSPKIVLPQSQLAAPSVQQPALNSENNNNQVLETDLKAEPPNNSSLSSEPTLANLQATLNEAETMAESLETQAVENTRAQTQTKQNSNFVGNFAALPYAGFGGGGEMVNVNANRLANLEAEPPSDNLAPMSPVINSPSNFSQIFTSTTINFQGTAEASSTISTDFNSATTAANQNNNWQMTLIFPQGTTTLNFFAKDAVNNVSSSTSVELFVDSEAPSIPTLTIVECQNSLAVGACLVATTTLHISWLSDASDFSLFQIEQAGVFSTTTATFAVVTALDNATFSFKVAAADKVNNVSATTTATAEISTMPVVINEVAWAGTAAAYDQDEWIELYNRTDKNINLADWVLYSSTDFSPYLKLTGIIPAKGYYLIERTDETTISDIAADLIASFGNGLNNQGEVLNLSYAPLNQATTTIDQTALCGYGYYRWCPGDDIRYRTMERIEPDLSGADLGNWLGNIYSLLIANGQNAGANRIAGTPKARNSVNYLIAKGAGTINENTVLTKSRSPYLVNDQIQIVSSGATLTIEPGVTIKFYDDAGMTFNNAGIKTQGTANEPIVFTSFYDDEYGGDTNGDATSSAPSMGSWYGVDVVSGANGSIFDHSIFRYGGKYYTPTSDTDRVIVKIQDTPDISIKNSVFEHSKAHGLVLVNSTSTIENNILRNNNNSSEQGKGLYLSSGNYIVKNNEFSQNQTGLFLSDAPGIVDANTFSNNAQMAVYSSGLVGEFTNNLASQNGKNGIVLNGNLVQTNATSTLKADNIPYVISENNPVVPANSALTVESGAIIKGSGKGLMVSGRLELNGENPEDIVLTSLSDDSVGGDTDNNVSSPGPGNWTGINLAGNASFQGKGFTMRYAGSQSDNGNNSAGLKITAGLANIAHSLFDANYPHGIYAAAGSELNISNSSFENHNYSGPWGTKAALAVFNSTSTLANVSFVNNSLGIISDTISTWIAGAVEFINNTATTSPGGLF